MYRFLTSFLLAALFSWNVLATGPSQHNLFHRLNLDDSFLNSPVCSVKRKGSALVLETGSCKIDPAIQAGKVTFIGNEAKEKKEHGNIVAEITSRFLPKGRTYLNLVNSDIGKDLNNTKGLEGNLPFVVNFSIDNSSAHEESIERAANMFSKDISRALRQNKILVIAAGNDGQFLGGQKNLHFLFSRTFSKLTPQERKYIVFVGATHHENGREVLDTRYSNIPGYFSKQFIWGPSNFSSYSPESKCEKIWNGTSFSAPAITGLLTRALVANPHLTRDDAIQLLFQTASKRNLVSTKNQALDDSLYGNGILDARLFLTAAHALNTARTRGENPQHAVTQVLQNSHPNVLKDYRNDLRNRLDVLNFLKKFERREEAEFKNYKNNIQRIAQDGPLVINNHSPAIFTLDDFSSCSDSFKAQKLSERQFSDFILSKFPLTALTKAGSSLLTLSIWENRQELANHLLKQNFDLHFRGKNREGKSGLLPIHAAALTGNLAYVQQLLQRGASIHDLATQELSAIQYNPLLCTILGGKSFPESKDRLKILDVLYHQGANFRQEIAGSFLADIAEQVLGKMSPITQMVKYYAENSKSIKQKPLLNQPQVQKKTQRPAPQVQRKPLRPTPQAQKKIQRPAPQVQRKIQRPTPQAQRKIRRSAPQVQRKTQLPTLNQKAVQKQKVNIAKKAPIQRRKNLLVRKLSPSKKRIVKQKPASKKRR